MRLSILVFILSAGCFYTRTASAQSQRSVESESWIDAPLLLVRHTPFVKVRTGGREWLFLVDTGADRCSVSFEFVKENFLETAGQIEISDALDRRTNLMFGGLPPFRIGSEVFPSEEAVFSDFSLANSVLGVNIDGVIGFNILRRFNTTLDYRQKLLRLARTNLISSNSTQPGLWVPFAVSNGIPYLSLLVQQKKTLFLIDSGFRGVLALSAEWNNLEFVTKPRESVSGLSLFGFYSRVEGRLAGNINVGELEVESPVVWMSTQNVLGGEVLEHFVVTFDPVRSVVGFNNVSTNRFKPSSVRSIGIIFDRASTPWKVLRADRGLVAKIRDLREGDLCTSINDLPVSTLSWERFDDLISRKNVVALQISRGSSNFVVHVPVTVVVE